MLKLHRLVMKVAGESGQGVNSIGEIVAKALKETGFYTFGYREYPSLIKGGYACHQVDIADYPLSSSSTHTDILVCFSRLSFHMYLSTVRDHGNVIHMIHELDITPEEQQFIDDHHLTVTLIPAETVAIEAGGKYIMANVVMIGALWQLAGLPLEPLKEVVKAEFASKPDAIEPNVACLSKGFTHPLPDVKPLVHGFKVASARANDGLLTGNHLIALGAIAAGVRAYYAYPMTPSSSILSYLAEVYHETGMLVKQVDDEISVAQMAIGSMFMGTRALVGTSGGGFDLMTESVSMAGMTETPFVCILAQRPGPATGLPTWTSAADLNLAIHAGHGEFARCVIAISDPASAYLLVQHAFTIAEKYQTVVIVLTEKQIAESLFQVENLPTDIPIERHLVPDDQLDALVSADRYKITDSGISPRWLPGQVDATYDANSDEHLPDGSLTEEAKPSQEMYAKRLRKQQTLLAELPEPIVLGPATAHTTLVGWGSVRNTVEDVMSVWNAAHPDKTVNYLHYEYVYPLKTERFKQLAADKQPLVLVENNALGQLGALITQETGYLFENKLLKFDGRPFFVEDVVTYLEQTLGT